MNKINKFQLDGVSYQELANQYGTPLYLYSAKELRKRCKAWKKEFLDRYPNVRVSYASKAFSCIGIYQWMKEYGFGLDVVSGGEILTAFEAGFPMEEVEFNGNNKTEEELDLAMEKGVGRMIIDSFDELPLLKKKSTKVGRPWKVLLRVNPDVETHTHKAISTGHRHSKFGIPLEDPFIHKIISYISNHKEFDFLGLQFHVGSQLFDQAPYLKALDKVMPFGKGIEEKYNLTIKELNIGGGFGIGYTSKDKEISVGAFLTPIMEKIDGFYGKHRPTIAVEPGRHLVGSAGVTLYQIGSVKKLMDHTFVAVDGGMGDNLRPSLYGASYECALCKDDGELEEVEVVGRFCESGDVIIPKTTLPSPKIGDYMVVFATGAYHYSLANRYNRVPIPPVVLVDRGQSYLLIEGETPKDLFAKDRPLPMLKKESTER